MLKKAIIFTFFILLICAAIVALSSVPSAHAFTYGSMEVYAVGPVSQITIVDNTHYSFSGFTGFPSVYNNWIEGDSYTISATLSDNANLYFWSLGSPDSYPTTSSFTVTLTTQTSLELYAAYSITVNSAYGAYDGSGSAGQYGSYTTGVNSPVSEGSGAREACTGYSINGGAEQGGTSYTFNDIQAPQTITYDWQLQYYLTVSSGSVSDGTSGSGWYTAYSDAYASTNDQTVSGGTGIQYAFASWSYDSGSNYASDTVYMNGPITDTASWNTQYYLTVNSAHDTTSGSNWYNAGVTAYAGVSSAAVSGGTGIQYAFTGWSSGGTYYASDVITMNGPYTDTAEYVTQFYLTVTGGGASTGQGWYNTGSDATASSNYVWNFAAGQSRSSLYEYNLDGGSWNTITRAGSGSFTTPQIPMDTYHTVTFNGVTQYSLTVTGGSSISYGTSSPTGDNWYDSGSSTTVLSSWVWGTVPSQSRTTITNYAIDGVNQNPTRHNSGTLTTSSISMSTYHTVAFASATQFYLAVSGGNSISFGTASPTSDQWYDSGTSTTVSSNGVYSRSSGSGTRVSSWNLDGGSNTAANTVGTVTTSAISMGTYHTVTFNTVTQYQVTLDSGATAALSSITSPTVSGDNYWYDSGTTVTISLNGVWGRSGGSGTRLSNYALNGGSNIPTYTTSAFNVFSGPLSSHEYVTTTTVSQYFLTVTGGNSVAYGTASTISGDTGWYDTGTLTTVSSNWVWTIVAGQSRDAINNYAVNSVNQNPTRQYSGTLTTGSLLMTAAQTVAFSAVVQYDFSVTSTYGSPTGAGWYDTGSSASSTVTTPVAGAAGVQYVSSGYTGTGSLTSGGVQGTSTTGLFSITAVSTCVWNWLTQYEITPSADAHSTITPSTAQWVNSGNSEAFTYSPNSGYTINLVLVNGTSVPITGSFTFTHVSAPQTIAVSTASNTFTITATADAHSTISPSGAFPIAAGGSQAFSFSPSTGYYISAVTVNGTSESTTSPYTFTNVEANYVISVSTTAYATLNLQTIDEQGNVLSGTTITLNGTAYQTTVGVLQLTNLLTGTDYAGSVTWQNVDVNASFNIELLTQNTALNIVCTAYPYQFNNVLYEVATNRPVTSETWDGTHFTIFFSASLTSNALVFDAPQVPTYLSGLSYSLASDWNPSTDVFTYTLSNSTFQAAINFDNFGSGFYLQEIDTPISTVTWTGQAFTINLETNGTGNLIIQCSTRGVPTTVKGMTAVYDSTTNFLTGTYTDNDQIIVDWTQTTTPPGGGGTGGGITSNVDVAVSVANFGDVTLGENQTIDVSFTFTGTSLTVTGIQLTGNNSQYFKVDTKFPQTFFGGSGTITLELDLPLDATLGTFTSTLTLSATDAFGTTHTASSSVTYTAQNPGPGTTIQIPNNSTTEFAVALAVMIIVIVGSLAVLTRRRT